VKAAGLAAAALLAAGLLLPGSARAQALTEDTLTTELGEVDAAPGIGLGTKPNDDLSLYALPIPIVDPTIGNGLALGGLATFRVDPSDKLSPRASLAVGAGYTDSQSWAAGAKLNLSLDNDRYRFQAMGGYGSLNVKFYGLADGGPLQDNPVDLNLKGSFLGVSGTARIADHWYVGPIYRYLNTTSGFAGTSPPSGISAPELQANLSGLGLTTEYDSRDSQYGPRDGVYATAQLVDFAKGLGSDFAYVSFDASGSDYATLLPGLVLASNVRIAAVGNSAPFFALPFLSLRGFPGGRYLGQDVWQAQAELRWQIYGPVGLVGYLGAGQAAQSVSDFGSSKLLYSGGTGLRYQVSQEERISVGLDYALASDGRSAVYFRIGEAF
jgi:outer membrane protein assembly factor BamA